MKLSIPNPIPQCRSHSAVILSLIGLSLAGGHGVQAQSPCTLSLTPLASTSTVGSTVTFTVNLTGGTNLAGYDFNVLLNSAQMQFVGTAPFTNTDTTDFPTLISDTLSTPGDMRVSFGESFSAASGINNVGPTTLGTFQVKLLTALPIGGSTVAFGTYTKGANSGGSEVDDASTGANKLTGVTGATLFTPAPEPSQTAALGLGALGLCGLALRARRATRSR